MQLYIKFCHMNNVVVKYDLFQSIEIIALAHIFI